MKLKRVCCIACTLPSNHKSCLIVEDAFIYAECNMEDFYEDQTRPEEPLSLSLILVYHVQLSFPDIKSEDASGLIVNPT